MTQSSHAVTWREPTSAAAGELVIGGRSPAGQVKRGVVIMPSPWRGGMLRVAIQLSNLLSRHVHHGAQIRMTLAVPQGYDLGLIEGLDPAVSVTEVAFESLRADDIRLRRFLRPDTYPLAPKSPMAFASPVANGVSLFQADFWISLTGLYLEGPLAPWKPYAVFAPDFIQRYVPEIYDSDLDHAAWSREINQCLTMRAANAVFGTTPKTISDAIVYAGVPASKLVEFPLFASGETKSAAAPSFVNEPIATVAELTDQWDYDSVAEKVRESGYCWGQQLTAEPYFLWVTNTTQHKNHLRAIEMLSKYYEQLGGAFNCLICGPMTQMFARTDHHIAYIAESAKRLRGLAHRTGRVRLIGELPEAVFESVLRAAQFLWHNVIYDNGTFSVIEAAEVGVPSLSSNYPQIRYLCELYGINAEFFDAIDVRNGGIALQNMEYRVRAANLPPVQRGEINLSGQIAVALDGLLNRVVDGRLVHGLV